MDVDQNPLVAELPDSVAESIATESPEQITGKISQDNTKKRSHENDQDFDNGDNAETTLTEDNEASADPATNEEPKISKNQLRKQKRQKLREERREERKTFRKDRRHERKERKRNARHDKAEEMAKTEGIDMDEALRRILAEETAKRNKLAQSRPVPVAFIIDCDFEKYMHDNELLSLSGQITRSYSMNKTGLYQAHLVMSSWGGKLKERFDTVLITHKNWKGVSFVEGDFIEAGEVAWNIMHGPKGGRLCEALEGGKPTIAAIEGPEKPAEADGGAIPETTSDSTEPSAPVTPAFSTDSVVYLSADSPFTLDKLEPNTSYVIGGIVDRNREKNLCQKRAEEKGIRTAKLPIGEYMQMASRRVLATNHVVEIMSKWLETGDWGEAFMAVIPKRKGGQLKGESEAAEDEAAEDEAKAGFNKEDGHENGEDELEAQNNFESADAEQTGAEQAGDAMDTKEI
ncbi:guanine-1-methyltransferase-domain-containing protein [Coniella lustricola]|uniref:tRNA (guanine(9)-N1)-methyltransferase n=1 Tax=Coniella lustricola TaxID=2025994 RepID=A0A2T3AHK9_9PEZI|nr:guanine-1-methyltransferase-domain-containing protein [Coniella lustricola]